MKHNRLHPEMTIRVLLKNTQLDLLECIALELKKLGEWEARAKESDRDGYDRESTFNLIKSNEVSVKI